MAQALLDLKGDGRLTLEVFQAWWHEGDHRWELFDMSEAQRERAQATLPPPVTRYARRGRCGANPFRCRCCRRWSPSLRRASR